MALFCRGIAAKTVPDGYNQIYVHTSELSLFVSMYNQLQYSYVWLQESGISHI